MFSLSYQFWNGHDQSANSSTSTSPIHRIKKRLINVPDLLQQLGISPRKSDLLAIAISHEVALCQRALNGLSIGDQFKPEFTLRGKYLDTLELKVFPILFKNFLKDKSKLRHLSFPYYIHNKDLSRKTTNIIGKIFLFRYQLLSV